MQNGKRRQILGSHMTSTSTSLLPIFAKSVSAFFKIRPGSLSSQNIVSECLLLFTGGCNLLKPRDRLRLFEYKRSADIMLSSFYLPEKGVGE